MAADRQAAPGTSDAALVAVYREHFRFVWRLCRSLGVDAGSADDVAHDVFLVVRRRMPARDDRAPMRAWLARITRNVVMHHHRGRARRAARLRAVAETPAPRSPDEELGAREAAALLERFLDTLEQPKREVFVLMEVEGVSAPEVARIVGAKTPTVYTRLRAARQRFEAFVRALDDPSTNPTGTRCHAHA